MYDLKACIVCFSIDVKLYNMNNNWQLRHEFHLITGLKTSNDSGLPDYLCYQCAAYLKACKKFRDKCLRAHYALNEILNQNEEIKQANLTSINRSLLDLMPPLSFMSLDKAHYKDIKFQWIKPNQFPYHDSATKAVGIPILHCSTISPDETFQDLKITNIIKNDLEDNGNEEDNSIPDKDNDSIMDQDDNFVSEEEPDMALELNSNHTSYEDKVKKTDGANGTHLDEEYAMMVPISVKEAKAAIEVYKLFSYGEYHCDICNDRYLNENRLKVHMRMHDKHISGNFHCALCNFFYKTELLLKTHMSEKHMYKYVCRQCPEVTFDRGQALTHYRWHKNVTYQCPHCKMEFHHQPTAVHCWT